MSLSGHVFSISRVCWYSSDSDAKLRIRETGCDAERLCARPGRMAVARSLYETDEAGVVVVRNIEDGREPPRAKEKGKKCLPALRVCEWRFSPSRKDQSYVQRLYVWGEGFRESLGAVSSEKDTDQRKYARLVERRRNASFATELKNNLFDGSRLRECEHNMSGKQGRLDVYGSAFKCKDIGVKDNVNARLVRMRVVRLVSGWMELHILVYPA
jgi:hypothetical protein